MRILSLAGRRLAASIPTLFLILIGVFLLLQLAPGDTVDALMAQMGGGDAATARELRKFYGLDLSIPVSSAIICGGWCGSISASPRSTASRWLR